MKTVSTTADGSAGVFKQLNGLTMPVKTAYLFIIFLTYFIIAVLISWTRKNYFIWGDDAYLLSIAANNNMLQCLFGGAAAAVSQADFEPLLGPIFRIYWLLFHLDVSLYYWTTPLLIAGSALAVYCLFTRLVPNNLYAVFCGAVLALSPAVVSAAGNLTCQNYILGLICALAALCFAKDFAEDHYPRDLWLTLILSFLAVCLKSLYFPIYIVNLYLIVRGKSDVKKSLIGFTVIGLIYFGLRAYALKTILNVYTDKHDIGQMILGTIKSIPRLLETVVWGVGIPGKPNVIAVAVGALIVLGTMVMAYLKNSYAGVLKYLALLFLSLCIPAFVFWVPIISYFNDKLFNMGDRLVVGAIAVIWLTFLYYGYHFFVERYRFNKPLLIACLAIGLVIFCLVGGVQKSRTWADIMMSNSQAKYLMTLPKGKYLIVAEPAWYIQPLNTLIMKERPGSVLVDALTQPKNTTISLPMFSTYYRLTYSGNIEETKDVEKAKAWLDTFRVNFCRKFPFHCAPPKKSPTL